MVSAYALGYALFALAAGPISDRFNRKTVMLSGLAGFILSTFLCGIAPSFAAMCAFRFAAGVSAEFVTPQIWASIPVIVHPSKVLKSMGIATAGLAVSQMLGLPIGGFLASFTWHTPFFVLSAGSLVLLFILAAAMPDIRPAEAAAHRSSIVSPYRELFSLPKTSMILLAYFLFQTGNFATFSFLGTWLSADYHLTVSQIGSAMLVLGLGNMLGSLIGSKIASMLGTFKTLISGMLLMGALYFSLPFFPSLFIVETSFFLTFFIAGIIFQLMMGIYSNPFHRTRAERLHLFPMRLCMQELLSAHALPGFYIKTRIILELSRSLRRFYLSCLWPFIKQAAKTNRKLPVSM